MCPGFYVANPALIIDLHLGTSWCKAEIRRYLLEVRWQAECRILTDKYAGSLWNPLAQNNIAALSYYTGETCRGRGANPKPFFNAYSKMIISLSSAHVFQFGKRLKGNFAIILKSSTDLIGQELHFLWMHV